MGDSSKAGNEEFRDSGRRACKKLQELLDKKANGDALGRVALRIIQGLDAKVTKYASFQGKLSDPKHLIDFGARANYAKLVIDVFGAKEAERSEIDFGKPTMEQVTAYMEDKEKRLADGRTGSKS